MGWVSEFVGLWKPVSMGNFGVLPRDSARGIGADTVFRGCRWILGLTFSGMLGVGVL